jgi:serine/threonine protein kinase
VTTWVGPTEDPRRYQFDGDVEPGASGGEGFVYRGRRTADGLPVAIKQLISVPPGEWPGQIARIRVVGAVDHPRLGRHLDAFVGPYPFTGEVPPAEEFELLYTIMAWVDGRDLSDAAPDADLPTAFGWVRDVAHAATALHRHPTPTGLGIVHRDIKPSNVRVDDQGAVLVDFGIARPMDGATMTRNTGAPGWMPPESFDDPRSVGVRSDTWQVGGLAAWVLLGSPPGALVADDRRERLDRALRARGIPAARPLARHIDQALSARPGERPAELDRWGDGLVALASASGGRNRRAGAIGVAVAIVALAAGGSLAVARLADDPEASPTTSVPPPIGDVTVEDGRVGPYDFGEGATVNLTYATPPPPAAQVTVEPYAGGVPVANAVPATAPADPAGQQLTFTVRDGGSHQPVVVDELDVHLRAPGHPDAERRVSVRLTFAPPLGQPEHCDRYDTAALQVDDRSAVPGSRSGGPRWQVRAGPVLLADTTSRSDANQVLAVARGADARCLIGAANRSGPPLVYWRHQGRLIGPPVPVPEFSNARCVDYDAADLSVGTPSTTSGSAGASGVPLSFHAETLGRFDLPADADKARDLARHYDRVCYIGRSSRPPDTVDPVALAFWE